MPVEVNIIMDLADRRNFEERVWVPPNTKVRFIVRIWNQFLKNSPLYGALSFNLYFENNVPNGFNKNNIARLPNSNDENRLNSNSPSSEKPFQDLIIAEGTVKERGEYKYGISASMNGEELFDEDPYLIVR